jgi:DNA polymerase III gamma/tau subunit
MSANQKRSLLREAKQVMDASFVGGGEVASKVREHVLKAYAQIANGCPDDASQELVEAYELLRSGIRYDNYIDILRALHALDLGLFIHAFATADDELRAIGWAIWDARNDLQASLYDAINAAREFLSLVKTGVRPDVAAREVASTDDLAKLVEILEAYVGAQK